MFLTRSTLVGIVEEAGNIMVTTMTTAKATCSLPVVTTSRATCRAKNIPDPDAARASVAKAAQTSYGKPYVVRRSASEIVACRGGPVGRAALVRGWRLSSWMCEPDAAARRDCRLSLWRLEPSHADDEQRRRWPPGETKRARGR